MACRPAARSGTDHQRNIHYMKILFTADLQLNILAREPHSKK